MSRLKQQLKTVESLCQSGHLQEAREALARVQSDPDIRSLGQLTPLGLPRKLVSTLVKLARSEQDPIGRIGYQYQLVPETGLLDSFTQLGSAQRRAIALAQRDIVPHCIHQIWIGAGEVPIATEAWRSHAQKQGYEFRLWRERDLQKIGTENIPLYRQLVAEGNLPAAVDVARYFVLQKLGGIYLDCDYFPARDDLSFHDLLPLTGLSAMAEKTPRNTGIGSLLLSNGMLAASPRHPVFTHLLDILEDVFKALPEAPAWWSTGPLIFTLVCRNGPVTVADAGFLAGSLPQQTSLQDIQAWCQQSQTRDGGLLLSWKSWIWEGG